MKNNNDQKNIKTCKNTQESPLISTENSSVGNPIYNMREKVLKICTVFLSKNTLLLFIVILKQLSNQFIKDKSMIKLISASLLASTIILTGCGSKNNENELTSEQKQELEKRKERASQKGNILDGFDPNKDSAKPSGNGLDSYKPSEEPVKKDSSKPSGNGLDSYDPDHTQNKNK